MTNSISLSFARAAMSPFFRTVSQIAAVSSAISLKVFFLCTHIYLWFKVMQKNSATRMESKGGIEVFWAEYGMPTRFARCGGRNDGFTSIALPFTVLPPVAHPHKAPHGYLSASIGQARSFPRIYTCGSTWFAAGFLQCNRLPIVGVLFWIRDMSFS